MDITLYMLDEKTGARVNLPHGQQSRFHTEAEATARAEELRGEAAALGDKSLPAFAVVDINGELLREIRDAAPQPAPDIKCATCGHAHDGDVCDDCPCRIFAAPAPVKKIYRVRWTEEYSKDVEAETPEQAEELRDDDNAFMGCVELSAEPLCEACKGDGCPTCQGRGSVAP